jgi:hypothetical protein
MQTFLEYMALKDFSDSFNEIIQEVNEETESNPVLKALLEGFWGNVGTAAKNFVQGAWSGGGIKTGAQTAWSALTGPATQIQTAIGALTKAKDAVEKNPQWKQSTTFSGKGPLLTWLTSVLAELGQQQKQFQNLQNPSTTQAGPQSQPMGKGGQPNPSVPTPTP